MTGALICWTNSKKGKNLSNLDNDIFMKICNRCKQFGKPFWNPWPPLVGRELNSCHDTLYRFSWICPKKYRTLTYLVFWKPVIWSPQKDSNTFVCYKMYIGVIQFCRNISLKRLLRFLTLMLKYFCQKGSYRDIVWLIRLKDTKFSSRNKWCVNGTIEQEVVQEHCDQKVTSSSPTADVIISFIYYLYFLSLAAWSIGWEIIKMTRKKRVLLEAAYHHSDGRLTIDFVISQIGFLERRVV